MEEPCVNHWVIEPASGPHSLGRCKLCNGQGLFANSTPEGMFRLPASRKPKQKSESAGMNSK